MPERKRHRYYQRPDGLFETIRTIDGKRVAFRARSEREVDRKLLAYKGQLTKGRPFPVIADEWERLQEPKITEATRRVYSVSVKRLKAAFPNPVSQIKPLDIKRYMAAFEEQGYAAGTVSTELSVCKMIFSYAVLAGDIDVSPAAEVKKSRKLPQKTRQALTEEQEAIVKASGRNQDAHWWLFGYLLLYTGLRRGEALALSYSDIDWKKGVIRITKKLSYASGQAPVLEDFLKTKNGKREILLLSPLSKVLPRNRIGLIFPGQDGNFMKASELNRHWESYCQDLGLTGVTPHCFRHSYATICYEAGLDAREAARFLGDTPEVVEKVYTHLRNDKQDSAANKLENHLAATI